MKSLFVNFSRAVFTLAVAFAATPVFAGHVLDFQVLGKGGVVSDNCPAIAPLATGVNCTIVLGGQASGTHIGHDDFSLTLRVTALGTRLFNGDAEIGGVNPGLCVVVHGFGNLNPPGPSADPPSISFNVVGTVCEERVTGSPLHFNGTYRITGGDNRFEGRSGGGRLTATYTRGTGDVVYLHLHGTIDR